VAFSCKGRGVCPSCNTRRMVETAAHLTDHVFPRLPVRQWVLSVPKRLRYFMQRDGATLNLVLRIFLRVIAQSLQAHSPGAAQVDKAALHIGAIAFIHRFGSSLNEHVHFHVCVVDGVFEEVPGDGDVQVSPPGVIFHPASGLDETAVAQVQATLRRRILRAFVGRSLLESCDAKDMLAYQHSGFSVDAGVCIEAHDRAALERLLRRAWGAATTGPARARTTQTRTIALPVGGVDRPHLRGVPSAVSDVWWPDVHHRVHHAQRRHPANTGPHRGRLGAATHLPGTRATAVG
jgi:Putative transposase/Transposase zinc-binding domain